ncbi:MAG: EAL domain-containing protein [Treponema sp.]|nr:EAL domain-containing protein [Candidatus Treponema equifaecale]
MDVISIGIFKPERILYYIEPSQQEVEEFYAGKIPESLMAYNNVYGTYDCPGFFRIMENGRTLDVLGIEFRKDDEKVNYPKNLKSLVLKSGLMQSGTFVNYDVPSKDEIWRQIEKVIENKGTLKAASYDTLISIEKEPAVIQIFTLNKKTKYLISSKEIQYIPKYMAFKPQSEIDKELYEMAYKDRIIGCSNWNYMFENISYFGFIGIQDFSFVYFDIKDFKSLNVVYGHSTANKILRRIADKMEGTEWVYHCARADNDNFAMMIKTMPEEETFAKLKEFFSELEVLPETPDHHIFYRAGVVPMRTALLLGPTMADAGKQVQRMGNKNYETEILFYTESMYDEMKWAEQIKSYIDVAIQNDEFLVYLQPKYDIRTEKIHGAEALIRWKFNGKELLPPYRFVPIFERDGLITKIDDIVLHKVCRYLKRWKEQNVPLHPVSVNLSRKSMGNPKLVEHLASIVDQYGIDHSLIDFELTESAAHDNQNYMVTVIQKLKDRGFKISMDDFGTGYSSLSLLTDIPLDTIKIDKSFVDDICRENSYKECSILKHIISIGKDLNLTCLAEGAEDKAQIDLLRAFGCEIVQGYYYSKPVPVDEYEQLLV